MLQEKQEMQPLKVFWEKDVLLKIAALTVARWNCPQNTWKIPIKRFIFFKAVSFYPDVWKNNKKLCMSEV